MPESSWSIRRTRPRSTTRAPDGDPRTADLVVVLGGDGTMLRALQRTLGSGDAGDRRQLRRGRLPHVDRGDDLEAGLAARRSAASTSSWSCRRSTRRSEASEHVAVNDVVVASSIVGRMIELGWAVGGEDLGELPCDGVICCDPVRLDGLQPLERRPGARLGPRRAGGDLHRAALAARTPARRAARTRRRDREPDAST